MVRYIVALMVSLALHSWMPAISCSAADKGSEKVERYCRFQVGNKISYGRVEGNRVRQLSGDLFGEHAATNKTYALDAVKLLAPTRPSQVLALAGNYKSHLGDIRYNTTTITTVTKVKTNEETLETTTDSKTTTVTRSSDEIPERNRIPQPFFKTPSCLVANGDKIIRPRDTKVLHYEAEMVIVIGKRARDISAAQALDYVFGVTCGNDVSARDWQKGDVQWWRAKGSDTFGPCGPFIARGLNYDDLLLELRLNGETRQKERTSHLIHDVSTMVSMISQYVTLNPGDLIFTGTPGTTSDLNVGDVVEVELEGVGILSNEVVGQ